MSAAPTISPLRAFAIKYLAPFRELLVALLDLIILSGSTALMYLFYRKDAVGTEHYFIQFALLIICVFFFLILFRAHNSLWKYASSREYLFLIAATVCGYLAYLFISYLILEESLPSTFSLLTITFSLLAMLATRLSYRQYREHLQALKLSRERIPVIVIGAGDAGAMVLDECARNKRNNLRPVCMVDDDPSKVGSTIHNIPIEGPIENLSAIVDR